MESRSIVPLLIVKYEELYDFLVELFLFNCGIIKFFIMISLVAINYCYIFSFSYLHLITGNITIFSVFQLLSIASNTIMRMYFTYDPDLFL